MQDIFVVLAMVALSAVGVGTAAEGGAAANILVLVVGAAAMLAFIAAFIRYLADPLTRFVSRSPELLVIAAVGWAIALAALGDAIGFGKELGGLLAGVSLASTPFRDAIGSRLTSLRDFLLLFFFIALGSGLELSTLGAQIGPAIVLSLFVLIGNPLIVLAIMGYLGYRKRTGFLAGLTVAQISEFSLIFMAMGVSLGQVGEEAMGLVTLVGLVTIALSVYMITWSHKLYEVCEPLLGMFERRQAFREIAVERDGATSRQHDFVIFGLGRYGQRLGSFLAERGYRVLGVDFDPEALSAWRDLGMEAMFGDATDPDFVTHLSLDGVRGVISAVPRERSALTDTDAQLTLLHGLRASGFPGRIVLSANTASEAEALRSRGADLVLTPFDDAAEYAVERLVAA